MQVLNEQPRCGIPAKTKQRDSVRGVSMSVIKRSVQRNGKTYLQVKVLDISHKDTEHYDRHDLKDISCFMCVSNAADGNKCKEYHHMSPPCQDTKDLIFISEHSLKRYIKMAVIQRMEKS